MPSAFQRNEMQSYTWLGTSRKCRFSTSQIFALLQHFSIYLSIQKTPGFSYPLPTVLIEPVFRINTKSQKRPCVNRSELFTGQKKLHWTLKVPFLADKCRSRHVGAGWVPGSSEGPGGCTAGGKAPTRTPLPQHIKSRFQHQQYIKIFNFQGIWWVGISGHWSFFLSLTPSY